MLSSYVAQNFLMLKNILASCFTFVTLVLLDFRDQTPPKDSGLFKTGVWIFSSKKLTKFGPFRQFFNGAKKEKLFGLHFSTETRHKLEGSDSSHLLGGGGIQCKSNIPHIIILGLILGLL